MVARSHASRADCTSVDIEDAQSLDQHGSCLSPQPLGPATRGVYLPHDVVEDGVKAPILTGTQRRQSSDQTLQVRGSGSLCPAASLSRTADSSGRMRATPTARRQSSNTSITSASQNSTRTGLRRGPLAQYRSKYRSMPR